MSIPPRAAIHEAGHAITALATGCQVMEVQLFDGRNKEACPATTVGDGLSLGHTMFRSKPYDVKTINYDAEVKIAVAGFIAEYKARLISFDQSWHDQQMGRLRFWMLDLKFSDLALAEQSIDGLLGVGATDAHRAERDKTGWAHYESPCDYCAFTDTVVKGVHAEIIAPSFGVIITIARKLAKIRYMEGRQIESMYDRAVNKGSAPPRPATIPSLSEEGMRITRETGSCSC
jgi:hypothetical protein